MARKSKLDIVIDTNNRGAIGGIGKVIGKVGKLSKTMSVKLMSASKTAFDGIVAGATAAAAAVGGLVTTTVGYAGDLTKLQSKMGLNIKQTQRWASIARVFGADSDAMADAIKEAQMRTAEFADMGAGPAAEAFKQLGISQEQAIKATEKLGAGGLFKAIVGEIRKVENKSSRMNLADQLFGGAGAEQLFGMIEAPTERVKSAMESIGKIDVIDKGEHKNIMEFRSQVGLLGEQLRASRAEFVGELLPQLSEIVNKLQEIDWSSLAEDLGKGLKKALDRLQEYLGEGGWEKFVSDLDAAWETGKKMLKEGIVEGTREARISLAPEWLTNMFERSGYREGTYKTGTSEERDRLFDLNDELDKEYDRTRRELERNKRRMYEGKGMSEEEARDRLLDLLPPSDKNVQIGERNIKENTDAMKKQTTATKEQTRMLERGIPATTTR